MKDALDRQLKAIANPHRRQILEWLKDPRAHFPPQVDGDLVEDGACAVFIMDKLGLAQPTTAQHLKALVDAGLILPKRIRQWTFYRRDEAAIADLGKMLAERL
ncbi:ArsR/SmtB family transcription factor [Parasphingopyxis marina]|uniref:Helix-turn-helix transcriptional regulator n=1 Tax=Parasphingopyxis marina TaxID=2761622 RepID=A0A842HWT3_9SPHN|nr:helix-turn-helix domain-containing protein [Parasphingopyxis marina]MBC2777355.1 helix-turn-helix transcriptional regulator [Parasphingopyxis marina]